MTILLIDAGNTRVKWALADDGAAIGAWIASGAAPHAELAQLAASWRSADRALIANVAGPAMRERLLALLPAQIPVVWFVSAPHCAGVVNGYRDPAQLGCDRFAAAIGAHQLVQEMAPGQAIVVANCGTATTIDALDASGRFLGGMILPGLGLMAASLARNTAQLPHIAGNAPPPAAFADNTADAILAGCLAAQAGAIERAVAQAVAAHGAVTCIVSGGAAQSIAPALTVAHRLVDNIVMIGLHTAAGAHRC